MNGVYSSIVCSRVPLRQGYRFVAGLLLLLVLGACATTTSEQPVQASDSRGIAVVPLVDGGTRIDVSTDAAFDFGRAGLRTAFAVRLAQVVKPYLQQAVRVSGYTDNVGAPAFNLDLSQRRALAIAEVLREQGVSDARLTVSGYGEDNPVASNATEAGRRLNRRIELLFTAQVP